VERRAPAGTTGPGATVAGPGSTGGPGQGSSGDPCTLLSANEVWSILNSDPLVASNVTPGLCAYRTSDSPGGAATVRWQATGGEAMLRGLRDSPSYEVVEGIGDEALRDGNHLVFRLGDQLFEVQPTWGGPDEQAQALTMAKVIIARVSGQPVPEGLIPTTPPALSTKDPCKLLSGEEAGTALGTGPLTARNNDSGGSNQPIFCFYSLSDGTAALSTYLDPKGGLSGWEIVVADVYDGVAVDGVGDEAIFEALQGKLYVLKGDAIITVNVFTVAPEAALAPDRQLIELILSRL